MNDDESHVQVTVANGVGSGESPPESAESAELAAFNMRNRQTNVPHTCK